MTSVIDTQLSDKFSSALKITAMLEKSHYCNMWNKNCDFIRLQSRLLQSSLLRLVYVWIPGLVFLSSLGISCWSFLNAITESNFFFTTAQPFCLIARIINNLHTRVILLSCSLLCFKVKAGASVKFMTAIMIQNSSFLLLQPSKMSSASYMICKSIFVSLMPQKFKSPENIIQIFSSKMSKSTCK